MISIYHRIYTYQVAVVKLKRLQTAGGDVAICGSVHLRTQICRIFRIHKLMWQARIQL